MSHPEPVNLPVGSLLTYGLSSRGKGETKVTSFPWLSRTLNPHLSMHRFYQLPADVESQPAPSHRSRQITLETHKFLKEQCYFIGGDTRTGILNTDTYVRVSTH